MSGNIKSVSSSYGDSDKISELHRVASQVAAGLEGQPHFVAAPIETSKNLKPGAHKADDAGCHSFKSKAALYQWHYNYEGALQGRTALNNPDGFHLLWFIKYDQLFLERLQEEQFIAMYRNIIHNYKLDAELKQNFLDLIIAIQLGNQTRKDL